MPTSARCTGADHRPPSAGGSCPCGMVTLVPARPQTRGAALRELLARVLDEPPADGAAALDADRVLAALAAAGLTVTGPRLPA